MNVEILNPSWRVRMRPQHIGRLPGGSILRKQRMRKKRDRFEGMVQLCSKCVMQEIDRRFISSVVKASYREIPLESRLMRMRERV